jgi:serine/threonine protein phosphatase PrpC
MRRIVAAGGTDVGRVRDGNEDAYLVADSVFAVADGMGGHLAGEIASAKALEPVEQLDGKVYADPEEAVEALRRAVEEANHIVSQLADDEPLYRGMGTTLTAVMVEGRRLHLAHVGDSRAYLLRDGTFRQLTDDHTLVQHLIDEGQISKEEAASHPQRSIITRAIGVSREVDVDSMSLDLQPGDQILLCSDGLTGVLSDEEIERALQADASEDDIIAGLIERANEGGGPDNITVVILRYDPDGPGDPSDHTLGGSAAAAGTKERGEGPIVAISTRDDGGEGDWAGRLGNYGTLGRDGGRRFGHEDDDDRRRGGWLARVAAIVTGIVVLVALLAVGGWFLLSQQYYVGLDDEQVVIYRGVDATLGPFELARIAERTQLGADEVPAWYRSALEDGVTAADLSDARRIVANAPRRDTEDADGPLFEDVEDGEDAGTDPTDGDGP